MGAVGYHFTGTGVGVEKERGVNCNKIVQSVLLFGQQILFDSDRHQEMFLWLSVFL